MRIPNSDDSGQDSDEEFQEDGSTVLISAKTLAQSQNNIEPDNSSNMQNDDDDDYDYDDDDEIESQTEHSPLINDNADNDMNQQNSIDVFQQDEILSNDNVISSIDIFQQDDLSQILSNDNVSQQNSIDQDDDNFENQQNSVDILRQNSLSQILSNNNEQKSIDILQQNSLSQILLNDNLHDQRIYENDFNSRPLSPLSEEESQVLNEFEHPTAVNFDELNLFNNNIGNDTEIRKSKPTQNSRKGESSVNNIKSRTNSKKNISKVLRDHKYYSIDSSIEIELGKDLAEYIPGLYRLLDLREANCPSDPEKIIISKDSLKKLCNDMIPSSFKSISEINYTRLNSISLRLIGCYGNHALIAKFLLDRKIINQQIHDLLIVSKPSTHRSSLHPGIYLLMVNPDLGLVIHWPNFGCYEEDASSQHKNNMINLHRYLTKLTDCQLCLMSDKDLERIDWNLNNSDLNPDNENGTCYEFEVKKSREERDDFKTQPGFKVNLSHKIKADINNNIQCDIPLYPIVVESTTNQSFITRKMAKKLSKNRLTSSASTFSTDLHNRMKGRSLYIDRKSMDMKKLKLLIDHGFKMKDELLETFHNAIKAAESRMDEKKNQAKVTMIEDAEIITRMGWKKSYSIFETFKDLFDDSENDDEAIDEGEINRIQSKYPEVKDMIKKIKINSPAWIKLKQRYALAFLIMNSLYRLLEKSVKISEEIKENAVQEFYKMFVDKETNMHKLVGKYEQRSQNFFSRSDAKSTYDNLRISQIEEQTKRYSQTKPDSVFVQDIISSQFFGNLNDIRQNVLEALLNEYQNWRKENFPNNVKEMVPKFSFNEKLMDRINGEFDKEKEEIEKREFERICNELEKHYRDEPLLFKISNMSNVTGTDRSSIQRFCLTYELETNQLQITIYETLIDKTDIVQIQDDEFYVPTPVLSSDFSTGQYGVDFQIDPTVYDFRKISQFDNKFLLILYNKKMARTEIFFNTAQKLAKIFEKSDPIKTFKVLNTDEDFLIAINELKGLIALLDTRKMVLSVLSFNDDRSTLYVKNLNIELLQSYDNDIPNIKYFLFIKDTEELCFVEKNGRARIFNLVNMQFRPAICNLPSNTANVLSSPDGSCIVAFVKETEGKGDDAKEMCRAYVYFCAKFGSSVSKVVDLPPSLQSLEFLQFTHINKLQTHLVSFDLKNGNLNSLIVKITIEKTQYRFQERTQKQLPGRVKLIDSHKNGDYILIKGKNTYFEKTIQNGQNIVIMGEKYNVIKVLSDTKLKVACDSKQTSGFDKWMEFQIEPIEQKTKLNDLIDVYKLMFEKYPIENCIDPELNRHLNLKIILDIDDDNYVEEHSKKFEDYIYENLRSSTKRLSTLLKNFSVSFNTFQDLSVEDVKFLKRYSSEYELGEWIIKLCCLIPIQIAVTENNLFQPLKDEMSWDEIDRVEFDSGYGYHIDSIAKNISFGWYEGILKHFSSKKVKVVSSMGERSSEKSFMLNHLIGTSFDESAMRCTEGVWMSLVNTKKYIYVALDFEGLESPARTPQEDLLLTLFNTFVSNLILFKNQFAVNRDLSIFQRFQNGAALFESSSKTKLCIVIKDAPKADKEETVKEFKSKFSQLVSEEGEDNFVSRMYKGGVDIILWPALNDTAWFKTLSNINKKLIKQEAKHENARIFLQNTKVIMAKLKTCDWSSLEETHIQIRVAALKRLLPTVVSYGLEQKDSIYSVTEQLMNHDTEEPIDDSEISLSGILHDVDILHNVEESAKLLPDSDIQLYDEDIPFVRLSEHLRGYFEENVPRKTSDDSKWFANFNNFLKYIIERRISRAQEWYVQNTVKFPKDNNDIVDGRYALEQEISKLTLFWTLCGLTCYQCGLKCVKSRGHEENHDCLTDHECTFLCDFHEHDKIVPQCSHKAGHKGDHTCNKINHLCGKPCSLADKYNCQKVCSKEIGHHDEHLCESRHYCGEDCSLFTYTQRGNYKCPNKCIIPYDEEHDSHRCENETCPIQCPVQSCQRRCQSNDHFHYLSDLQVDHFCGNEHPCQEVCEEAGVCKVITVPKRQVAFTKYIQLNERLRCNKKIPPNEFEHSGKHTHKEDGFHYCDAKCQFCEYYCTLPYGHTQIHETRHGNMTRNEITDDDGHKSETFVLCNLYCKDKGRHIHVDYCQNEENCKLGSQRHDIQHIDEKIQPHPDKPKDFLSHKLFWERTGFKDPYSVQEQIEFTKCNHECKDEKHKSQGSCESYCELPLFHSRLDPSSNPPNDYGYISLDGHHFNCENPE